MALKQTPPTFAAVTTGSEEYSVQLNDANLEGKAWKSSRYDGSRTVTTTLNRFTEGDITYGKTTAVQKYSRNIYIGNSVIGMGIDTNEDSSLVNFPNFSYVTTKRFITVNSDNTVENVNIGSKKLTQEEKLGFYKSFYEDFPIQGGCQIIVNDENIRTTLKDNYNIYFNGGLLQKLLHIQSPPDGGNNSNLGYITFLKDRYIQDRTYNDPDGGSILNYLNNPSEPEYKPNQGGLYFLGTTDSGLTIENAISSHTASLFNEEVYTNWFTGSLETEVSTYTAGVNSNREEVYFEHKTIQFSFGSFYQFISNFFNYQRRFSYKGDKRLFITLAGPHTVTELESGFNNQPIYTTRTGSYINEGIITDNFTELSTLEIGQIETGSIQSASIDTFELELIGSPNNNLSFNYQTSIGFPMYLEGYGLTESNGQPASFITGSVIISKTEDSTPSLLLKLVKSKELPDGTGRKSFVIIPENLHPHIKKNLTHFLAKAGVSLDLDTIPALDSTFEQLR
jgi:hypothetical protein